MTGQNITGGMGGAATAAGAVTLPNTAGDGLLTLLSAVTLTIGLVVLTSFVITRIAISRSK